MIIKLSVLILVMTLLFASPLHATIINGGLIIDQTWTPAGNPYIVQGDIFVPSGSALTIEAGTIVQFTSTDSQAAGHDMFRIELEVDGVLVVNGTSQSPVIFEALSSLEPSIWYGIIIVSSATEATINNAQIMNASIGLSSSAPADVLSVSNSSFQSNFTGVLISSGTPTLSTITSSGNTYGILIEGSGAPTISDSVLLYNSSCSLYISSPSGVTTVDQLTL
jgi:hypothetical protein